MDPPAIDTNPAQSAERPGIFLRLKNYVAPPEETPPASPCNPRPLPPIPKPRKQVRWKDDHEIEHVCRFDREVPVCYNLEKFWLSDVRYFPTPIYDKYAGKRPKYELNFGRADSLHFNSSTAAPAPPVCVRANVSRIRRRSVKVHDPRFKAVPRKLKSRPKPIYLADSRITELEPCTDSEIIEPCTDLVCLPRSDQATAENTSSIECSPESRAAKALLNPIVWGKLVANSLTTRPLADKPLQLLPLPDLDTWTGSDLALTLLKGTFYDPPLRVDLELYTPTSTGTTLAQCSVDTLYEPKPANEALLPKQAVCTTSNGEPSRSLKSLFEGLALLLVLILISQGPLTFSPPPKLEPLQQVLFTSPNANAFDHFTPPCTAFEYTETFTGLLSLPAPTENAAVLVPEISALQEVYDRALCCCGFLSVVPEMLLNLARHAIERVVAIFK